jgi:hypothetical protein
MDIFDHWKNLTTLKKDFDETDPEFEATYNPFMINRMASSVNAILPLLADIDRYDLPKKVHYDLMKCILPKAFIKPTFYKAKKESEQYLKYKKAISDYFEFGSRDLDLAMTLISQTDKEKIRRKFGGKE